MTEQKHKNVGAMWMNEGAEKPHVNIRIGEKEYVAFPNSYKKLDTQPDYWVYDSKKKNGG